MSNDTKDAAVVPRETEPMTPPPDVLRFERIRTAEIFEPIPPKQWVCESLGWAHGRPALLAGYGYSGKTLAAQCAALQLAAGHSIWQAWDGRDWCRGFDAGEAPRRVLHIDYEVGRDDTLRRYQRLARGLNIGPARLGDRLHVVALPRVFLNDKRKIKGTDALLVQDFLTRECDGVDVVFIDAFRGTIPGADENESVVRDYLDILTRVSEATRAAFVVLHHAGKEGKTDARAAPRGSSAIFDACGSVLQIEGSPERGDTGAKLVKQTKNSAAGKAASKPFGLVIVDTEGDGVRVEHCDAPGEKPAAQSNGGKSGEKAPEQNPHAAAAARFAGK